MQHTPPPWKSRSARVADRCCNLASWGGFAVFYALALPIAAVALWLVLARRG
ncbi:MAG: hypothetical protein JWP29_1168 [Rhodoferax sp.]|nr:hypothetical protein [Rhodoferax sp.]